MARRKAETSEVELQQLELGNGEWREKPPKQVQDAVDEYRRCLRAKNKANGAFNSSRENALDAMRAHDVKRIRVQDENGKWKWLVVVDDQKLKLEKITEPSANGDE